MLTFDMEDSIMSEVHEAAAAGDSQQILNLLNLGKFDVNQKDTEWHDRTPLHWAAIRGHAESIRILVDYGANVDVVTDNGWTPVHFAAEIGKISALKALHKLGANIEMEDCCGDTPRDVASIYEQTECVEFLRVAEYEDRIRLERERQEKLEQEERERHEEEQRLQREERHAKGRSARSRKTGGKRLADVGKAVWLVTENKD